MTDKNLDVNKIINMVIDENNKSQSELFKRINKETGYNDIINDYNIEIYNDKVNSKFNNYVKPSFVTAVKLLKDSYNHINNYYNISNELDIYKNIKQRKDKELAIIDNRINNYKRHNNRDNKMAVDEKNKHKTYQYILTLILIAYYVVFIVILISSGFISKQLYREKKFIILIIFYLTLPIYLDYLINLVNNFLIWIQEQFMIMKPELSYNDIIRYEDLLQHVDYSDKNESLGH